MSKGFYVGPSDIHGNGAFAQEPIRQGDVVDYLVQGLYAGGLAGGNRTKLGDFINHQSSPNGAMKEVPSKPEHFYLEAISDIEPGTEVTINYYDTPDWVAKPHQVDPENYKSWG